MLQISLCLLYHANVHRKADRFMVPTTRLKSPSQILKRAKVCVLPQFLILFLRRRFPFENDRKERWSFHLNPQQYNRERENARRGKAEDVELSFLTVSFQGHWHPRQVSVQGSSRNWSSTAPHMGRLHSKITIKQNYYLPS